MRTSFTDWHYSSPKCDEALYEFLQHAVDCDWAEVTKTLSDIDFCHPEREATTSFPALNFIYSLNLFAFLMMLTCLLYAQGNLHGG